MAGTGDRPRGCQSFLRRSGFCRACAWAVCASSRLVAGIRNSEIRIPGHSGKSGAALHARMLSFGDYSRDRIVRPGKAARECLTLSNVKVSGSFHLYAEPSAQGRIGHAETGPDMLGKKLDRLAVRYRIRLREVSHSFDQLPLPV